MIIEDDLYGYLTGLSGITSIVGNRIYPMFLPQDAEYPAISYSLVSGEEHHHIDVAYPIYQFSCWAKTYSEVKNLADEIEKAFQRYKGIMGSVKVAQCIFRGFHDLYDPDIKVYHIPVEIEIIYKVF